MKLTFFPWVRQGLAAAIRNPAPALRPTAAVQVQVRHERGDAHAIDVDAELFGPGDVLSLDRAVVIRTWPAAGATIVDDELVAVEFDRADLPWQFTPQAANGDRLLPWLQLVVVEPGAGVTLEERPGRNAVLRLEGAGVVAAQLPRPDEAGAFAHAQLVGATATDAAGLEAQLRDEPLRSSSRLLAARKLEKGREYVACLVPTFEPGRRAGLGEPAGGEGIPFAWSVTSASVELPVYFHWRFRCSADGGFREQAAKLQAQPDPDGADTPGTLGQRTAWAAPAPSLRKGFPLVVPSLFRPLGAGDAPVPAAADGDAARFAKAIESLQGKARTLVPPDYGAAHAPDGAFRERLNRNPALRAIAGLGVRVVQSQQEEFVAAVWSKLEADEAKGRTEDAEPGASASAPVQDAARVVRVAMLARLVGPQSQMKASPEIVGRLAWSSMRLAKVAPPTPGTLARPAPAEAAPPAALLPAVRRLVAIAGRDALLARRVRLAATPLPTPGMATFAGSEALSPIRVTVAAVDAAPPAPRFQLVDEGSPFPGSVVTFTLQLRRKLGPAMLRKSVRLDRPVPWHLEQPAGGADNAAASAFRAAAREVQAWVNSLVPPPAPRRPHFVVSDVLALLSRSPHAMVAARRFAPGTPPAVAPGAAASAPAAAPPPATFELPDNALGVRFPMWRMLHDVDAQAVLAHDEEVRMNRAALLELDPDVHEAFLVGLNDELLREVRWRKMPVVGAPTFFDSVLSELPEVKPLDQWGAKDNVALIWRSIPILLIRAELVRSVPRLSVHARSEPPAPAGGARPAPSVVPPMFSGQLDESTRFYGFGIRRNDLFDPRFGWRFVLEEQVTEPCFRTPANVGPGILRSTAFGNAGAAALASASLRRPQRAVLLATDLFPRKTP